MSTAKFIKIVNNTSGPAPGCDPLVESCDVGPDFDAVGVVGVVSIPVMPMLGYLVLAGGLALACARQVRRH